MTLNHRKSIKTVVYIYPYCAFPFWYDMHSRDTTVLIDFPCDLMSYTTPACFSTFFQSTMVPQGVGQAHMNYIMYLRDVLKYFT